MADLIITPANVQVVSAQTIETDKNAATAIVAGEVVTPDGSDDWILADASALLSVFGIALNDASAQQPLHVLLAGTIALGAVGLGQGQLYTVSPNSGLISDIGDIIVPNSYNILGFGNDSAQLVVRRYSVPFLRA